MEHNTLGQAALVYVINNVDIHKFRMYGQASQKTMISELYWATVSLM